METSLHQQLKRCYADGESNTEVVMGKYRIDAIRDHELIEVQCASLSAIAVKCQNLLKRHQLRVVKPIVLRMRIAKRKQRGGPVSSRRMSPKRGNILDIFEELIYFTRVFPHRNLILECPLVHVEQLRVPAEKRKTRRRRWQKDYAVEDVTLVSIDHTVELREPADLLGLIDLPGGKNLFNTADIARAVDRPRWEAQRIAYVLRKTGAIDAAERNRNGILYSRAAIVSC